MARQILKHGLPQFAKGDNIPTDRPGHADFNGERVFIWNTWLPFYITAASFKAFGESGWAARLPFAVTGAMTVLLYMKIVLKLFGRNRRRVLIAFLLLVFSVPFLLHMRQSRYYALVTFGTLWMIWGYLSARNGKKGGWLHIAAGGSLCFYSFPAVAFLNLLALWIEGLLTGKDRAFFRTMALSSVAIFTLSLPAVWYMQLWEHSSNEAMTLYGVARSFWIYLLWINGFIVPFSLPVAASFILRSRGRYLALAAYLIFLMGSGLRGHSAQLSFLLLLAVIMVTFTIRYRGTGSLKSASSKSSDQELSEYYGVFAIMVVLYPAVMSVMSPYAFFRYILPLAPLAFILAASLLDILFLKSRVAGWIVLVTVIGSNLFSAAPLKGVEALVREDAKSRQEYSVFPRELWRWTSLRSDIFEFLYEITHDISDPEKVLVDYFRVNGKEGQVIKTSYDDITFMFYLPRMRVIPRWDYGDVAPDYVIVRGPYPLKQDPSFLNADRDNRYRAISLSAPDIIWCNNPDPLFHCYRTPLSGHNVIVYSRGPL